MKSAERLNNARESCAKSMRRFSETSRMDEEWYCSLPLEMRAAYELIWAKCDAAGVWIVNHRLADFQIGKKVDWVLFLKKTAGRVVQLDSRRYFLREFIGTNCGTLSKDCRAHNHVFTAIDKNKIPDSLLLSDSYDIAIGQDKDKDKEEEEDKEEEKDRGSAEGESFAAFWSSYPRKVGRGNAEDSWKKHDCAKILPRILTAVRACKASPDWTKDGGQFIPHPATWLNRKGWEDELLPRGTGGLRENITPKVLHEHDE